MFILPLTQKTCDPRPVIKYLHKYTEIWPLAFSPAVEQNCFPCRPFNHLCFLSLHPLRFQFSSVQSLSHVRLFATPWIAACQASLSITNSLSLLKLMYIELVVPSSHLTLCHPLLLLPSISPSIRVFSNKSVLCIRWPKFWSFSLSISMNIQDWFPLGLTVWISLQSKGFSRVFSNTTIQKHQFFGT